MPQHKTSLRLLSFLLAAVFSLCLCVVAQAQTTPTVSDIIKTDAVNTAVNFSENDFTLGFFAEGDDMTAIKIITLPDSAEASLTLDNAAVAANQEIAADRISGLTLTPATDWTGVVAFQYQAKANDKYSDSATVSVTISESLASPLTVENLSISVITNTPKAGALVGHSSDDDITTFEYVIEEPPTKGSVEITDVNTGAFVYTPNADEVGADSFTYKIAYHPHESAVGTVSVTIASPPNPGPLTVQNLSIATQKNTPKTGTLLGESSDPEVNAFDYMIGVPPTKGSVEVTDVNAGTFTYTPFADQLGTDTFTYKIVQEPYESATATVTVTITEPEPELFQYADMQTHWAAFTAGKLVEENMIIGYKTGNKYYFEPEKEFTRGDFVLMLTAAMGEQYLPMANAATFTFADDANIPYWIKDLAYSAAAAKVISGVGSTGGVYLNANEPLTRIDAIIMLNNAMAPSIQSTSTLDFADLNAVPGWGMEALRNLEGYGLVTGYDDNTFRPFKHVTKAEAAQMVYQFTKYVDEYPETREKWMGITPTSTTLIHQYNVETGYMSI